MLCIYFLALNESEADGQAQEASCGSWTAMLKCSTKPACGRRLALFGRHKYVQQNQWQCVINKGHGIKPMTLTFNDIAKITKVTVLQS